MFKSLRGNFQSTFKKALTGALKSGAKAISGSENNALLSQLNHNLTSVRQNVERSNLVLQLCSLVGDSVSVDDDVVITPSTVDINESDADPDILGEGTQFIHQTYGDMTLTDSHGLLYNLFFGDAEEYVTGLGNVRVFLKSARESTTDSLIIFAKEGKVYVNGIVRTANFVRGSVSVYTTIYGALRGYLSSIGQSSDGTILNGYAGTIQAYFSSLGGSGSTLFDQINSLAPSIPPQGKVRYFWDLVREYMESSELNSILLSACDAISNGVDRFTVWLTTVGASINNKIQCVREFFSNLSNAFYTGGFKGAIMYVYNYFATATSATDDDGLLVFTANSALVPVQYVVGTISQIISVASAAAGAIVSFFQPIIGALISLIGGVAYGIFKSISYDASATRCAIQTSDRVAFDAAPYALAQGDFDITEGSEWWEFANSTPLFSIEVPGGFLLCGPGRYNDDGMITNIRFEFHPSLVNRLSAITSFAESVSHIITRETTDQYSAYITYYSTLSSDQSWLRFSKTDFQAFIDNVYNDEDSISAYVISNQSDEHLSSNDDELMRAIILSNMWLFSYWICLDSFLDEEVVYPTAVSGSSYFAQCIYTNLSENLTMGVGTVAWLMTFIPLSTNTSFMKSDYKLSWNSIVEKIVTPGADDLILKNRSAKAIKAYNYLGDPYSMPTAFDYALVPAKYDATSFLTWILVTTAVTIAVAVIAVAVTFTVRKAIQSKRAQQNKAVESAWEEYKKGNVSYDEYRKTVKSANRWQSIIGGTRYDYENYWNGDISVPSSMDVPSDERALSTISGIKSILNNQSDDKLLMVGDKEVSVEDLQRMIYKLICGQ